MTNFDATPSRNPASNSPIADLSYRNYEGKLQNRAARWWIVALANIRLMMRKPGFWILVLLSCLPYLVAGVILHFGGGANNPFVNNAPGEKYATQFYQSLQKQQFWVFLLALLVGSGTIAADNRANALLVYLSKPITKGDYLLGKWMGIFLILFGVSIAPALVLYFDCLLSFAADGFLKNEPMLFWHLLLANIIPGAVHASLLVGFSAWSKTPRIAGAVYASFCLITGAITGILGGFQFRSHSASGSLITSLSVFGAIQGLAQNVFHVTIRLMLLRRHTGEMLPNTIPPPPLWAMLSLVSLFIVLGVAAARAKIQAVEVVRG